MFVILCTCVRAPLSSWKIPLRCVCAFILVDSVTTEEEGARERVREKKRESGRVIAVMFRQLTGTTCKPRARLLFVHEIWAIAHSFSLASVFGMPWLLLSAQWRRYMLASLFLGNTCCRFTWTVIFFTFSSLVSFMFQATFPLSVCLYDSL